MIICKSEDKTVTVGPLIITGCLCSLSVAVEVADPGVALGTLLLAGGELPHVALVLQLALVLLPPAAARSVGEVAVEDGRGVNLHNKISQSVSQTGKLSVRLALTLGRGSG